MTAPSFRNWQSVQEEVRRRIHARIWKPGDLIPNEADLALEFGCARTTVNRALRALAENGVLDRRRKAGTRVAAQPVAKATLQIAMIRSVVEERGQIYSYHRVEQCETVPPIEVSSAMQTEADRPLLHVRALHLADNNPYAFEDRWIDPDMVPDVRTAPFDKISANEWLLVHTPYTHGEIAFSATSATALEADVLKCPEGCALFAVDRLTWDGARAITKVRLLFGPGHQLCTNL